MGGRFKCFILVCNEGAGQSSTMIVTQFNFLKRRQFKSKLALVAAAVMYVDIQPCGLWNWSVLLKAMETYGRLGVEPRSVPHVLNRR